MPGDHPRVCGEHWPSTTSLLPSAGSSPRMRGTLDGYDGYLDLDGIIPAYAGNTMRPTASHTAPWDHPRVCGEHRLGLSMRSCQLGSSPRVRGAQRDVRARCEHLGIIPVCAGNTGRPARRCAPWRDHPRVCGEHYRLQRRG